MGMDLKKTFVAAVLLGGLVLTSGEGFPAARESGNEITSPYVKVCRDKKSSESIFNKMADFFTGGGNSEEKENRKRLQRYNDSRGIKPKGSTKAW